MTKEQAKKCLIGLGIDQPTDEQVTNYINSFNGEIQKAEQKANANKEELERLRLIEQELEAEREKNLTAEEKAKKAEEAVQKALEAAKQKEVDFAKKISRLSVEKIFSDAGITAEEYMGFIDGIVRENEEESKTMASNLVSVLNGKISSREEMLKSEFEKERLKNTPNPSGANGTGADGKSRAEELAVAAASANATNSQNTVLSHYI